MKPPFSKYLLVFFSSWGLAALASWLYRQPILAVFPFFCAFLAVGFYRLSVKMKGKMVLVRNLCLALCIMTIPVCTLFFFRPGIQWKDCLLLVGLSILSVTALLSIPTLLLPYLGKLHPLRHKVLDYVLVLGLILVVFAPFAAIAALQKKYDGVVVPYPEDITIVLEPVSQEAFQNGRSSCGASAE